MKRQVVVSICVVLMAAAAGCRATKQEYLTKGNTLFGAGKYEEASLHYRKAIQKDSGYGEAYYRLGLTAIKLDHGREAYEALWRASELLPENVDAKEKLADVCLAFYLADPNHSQSLYAQIGKLSNQLLQKNASSYEGLMLQGYLAATDRKPKTAIEFFHRALQVDSSNPGVVTELAHMLIEDGQFEEGERVAMDLIARGKTSYGPVYDLLSDFYVASKRMPDAEKVLKAKVENNPAKVAYMLELARYYNRQHQLPEMTATLDRLLDDPQDFPDARITIGDFYLGLHNFDEAIRSYQQGLASAQPKGRVTYQKKIVVALLNTGKKDDAARLAKEALNESPKDEGLLLLHAEILLDSGKRESAGEAVREFQILVAQRPKDGLLHLGLGRAYLLEGAMERARAEFQDAIRKQSGLIAARYELAELSMAQQPAETVRQANEILKTKPTDRRARLLRTGGLIATGDAVSARGELAQLIKEFPQDQEPRVQLGLLALAERKYPQAVETLTKYRDSGDTRVFAGLAIAYLNQKQIDKAREILTEGLVKSPESPVLMEQLAGAEALSGRYDLAIARYERMLAQDPKSIGIRRHLAEVYDLLGDRGKAIGYYQQAHDLAPNDVVEALNLAGALADAGRTGEAKALYQSVVKVHPENAPALNNAAYFLADTNGDLDEALRLAHNALAKAPGHPGFSDTIGYIYLKKGMLDSAIQTFSSLARKYPSYASFRYHLGLALYEKGEKASAKKELEAALADHPSAADKLRIQKLLDQTS